MKNNEMGKKHDFPPLNSPEALVRWAQSRDPIKIADMLSIKVHNMYHPGSDLPGLTCLVNNRPSIFINDAYFESLLKKRRGYTEDNIRDDMLQVIAHELGHSCLHRKQLREAPIKEYQIFDVRTSMEVEANKFAAAIRIDRYELLELLNSDQTILQVASEMHVNVNLLIYRIEMLREEGFSFNEMPYIPKNNFIGSIQGPGTSEWN